MYFDVFLSSSMCFYVFLHIYVVLCISLYCYVFLYICDVFSCSSIYIYVL